MSEFMKSPDSDKNKRAVILGRIATESGISDITEKLSDLPNTDLQSLLLDLYEKKADKRDVADILRNLREETYIMPSEVDQRELMEFDGIVCDCLSPRFRVLDLSPIVPFAVNEVLTGVSQNRVFSTTRNSEVISDPTTALAIIGFKERQQLLLANPRNTDTIELATSQRVIRQESKKKPEYSQHFRSFSLVAAGRDTGHGEFERINITNHLTIFLNTLNELSKIDAYSFNDIKLKISDVSHNEELTNVVVNNIIPKLRVDYPEVDVIYDDGRITNYYDSICYSLSAMPDDVDRQISIAGGGMVGWSQKLTSVKKERMLIGAIGSETICRHFKR